jgi:hypothetical protein
VLCLSSELWVDVEACEAAERKHDAVHIGSDSRVVGLEADRTLAPDFSDPIGSCEQTLRRWRLQ